MGKLNIHHNKTFVLVPIMIIGTMIVPPSFAQAAEPTSAESFESSSVIAPVTADDPHAYPYSSFSQKSFDETGGDPRVDTYWTTQRLRNAIPADQVSTPLNIGNTMYGTDNDDSSIAPQTASEPAAPLNQANPGFNRLSLTGRRPMDVSHSTTPRTIRTTGARHRQSTAALPEDLG